MNEEVVCWKELVGVEAGHSRHYSLEVEVSPVAYRPLNAEGACCSYCRLNARCTDPALKAQLAACGIRYYCSYFRTSRQYPDLVSKIQMDIWDGY